MLISIGSQSRRRQRGLSIVELMVGITIGLIVVAAASLVMTSQLGDNRRLLLETQLQQDLRATADIVTRELRRSGYWTVAYRGVWDESDAAGVRNNPMAALTPASGAATQVDFSYMRRPGDEGPYGFKLEDGIVKSFLGTGWQSLTDERVMSVTAFDITTTGSQTLPLSCPQLCADGTQSCWPSLTMRSVAISISAQSPSDASVRRTLNTTLRVRNDLVGFNDPAHPTDICPN